MFGGDMEVTASHGYGSMKIAGVVSMKLRPKLPHGKPGFYIIIPWLVYRSVKIVPIYTGSKGSVSTYLYAVGMGCPIALHTSKRFRTNNFFTFYSNGLLDTEILIYCYDFCI